MGNFSTKQKYIRFLLYIAVIILINVVGISLFFRADLTKDKVYSLSQASRDAVSTLSEPLSIKVFFSKDLPAPHNNTERYLRDLLEEYSARGGKWFNYTFYNVTPEEDTMAQKADENRSMANDYGIQPVQIRIVENDEIKVKRAYMGLVLIHGDLVEKIEAITSTNGLEYKLTTAIQKMNKKISALLQLDKKVSVTMYLSSSLNTIAPLIGLDGLPRLGEAITDTVEKLNAQSHGILDFKQVDLSDKAQLNQLGEKYNIMAMSWPAVKERNIAAGQGAAAIVVEYNGKATAIPLINAIELPIIGTSYQMADPGRIKEELNLIVEKLIGINKDIGYLSSHGTLSLMPDRYAMMQGQTGGELQTLNALVSSRYAIKQIDLKSGTIPDGLGCLIIARPTEKFTDYELFQIDQALMKGTNIAFMSDSFREFSPRGGMGGPQYLPIDTGLGSLLESYGISIKKAYVLDKECYKHQSQQAGGEEQSLYFIPVLKESSINTKPFYMDNIKGLITMQISPVELIQENIDKQDITATRLISSSDESWLMEGNIRLNPMFMTPPNSKTQLKAYDLAFLLEGTFTSYFKDREIPKKQVAEKKADEKKKPMGPENKKTLEGLVAENTILASSKPAKLFILPSSQMIKDNILDPEGASTNTAFILNMLDYLNGDDSIIQLRSKQQAFNPVAEIGPAGKRFIKSFNIVGLPVLVILFGFAVLTKRTARKKKIANRFKNA